MCQLLLQRQRFSMGVNGNLTKLKKYQEKDMKVCSCLQRRRGKKEKLKYAVKNIKALLVFMNGIRRGGELVLKPTMVALFMQADGEESYR